MIWNIISAVAAVISTAAYVLTALYLRKELTALDKDRYLSVTNELFALWQGKEFMEAQLWIVHRMDVTTWAGFIDLHRADYGEAAFHRVGSFYDRVGTLVRLGIIDEREILSTIGAYAIAAWKKMEPLVKEARGIENSVLFDDFEKLLPSCYECYVPALGIDADVTPFSLDQKAGPRAAHKRGPTIQIEARRPSVAGANGSDRITQTELKWSMEKSVPMSLVDVRLPAQVAQSPSILPGARRISAIEIGERSNELPLDREVVVYCA